MGVEMGLKIMSRLERVDLCGISFVQVKRDLI
jgi:hypothetical protein